MNLVIDIGNSTVKMAVMSHDNSLVDFSRSEQLDRLWISEVINRYNIKSLIWASTRNTDLETQYYLSNLVTLSVHFQSGITPVPIKNCYDFPERLGSDRLALAVGANGRYPGKNCLIFDFGTALTVDFLSSEGEFLGGVISPGLQLRLNSLHEHSALLPLLNTGDMGPCDRMCPSNTEDAMFQGVYNSMLYEVEGYISRHENAVIVFSGYDAKYFVDKFKFTIFAKYDILLLEGLNLVLENSKKYQDK